MAPLAVRGVGVLLRPVPVTAPHAEAEALQGLQYVDSIVLALAVRMYYVGQLAGERHYPPKWRQVVRVLGVLIVNERHTHTHTYILCF